jgi:uncharacterized membrane protein YtjA (UPF0391 family)
MQDDLLHSLADAWLGFGGLAASGARIAGIVIVAWLAIVVSQRSIRSLRIRVANRFDDREAVKRAGSARSFAPASVSRHWSSGGCTAATCFE